GNYVIIQYIHLHFRETMTNSRPRTQKLTSNISKGKKKSDWNTSQLFFQDTTFHLALKSTIWRLSGPGSLVMMRMSLALSEIEMLLNVLSQLGQEDTLD